MPTKQETLAMERGWRPTHRLAVTEMGAHQATTVMVRLMSDGVSGETAEEYLNTRKPSWMLVLQRWSCAGQEMPPRGGYFSSAEIEQEPPKPERLVTLEQHDDLRREHDRLETRVSDIEQFDQAALYKRVVELEQKIAPMRVENDKLTTRISDLEKQLVARPVGG